MLWYTQWKGHAVVRAAEALSSAVVSVDERSFPVRSRKLHAIGHGIDVAEFACTDVPPGPVRALVLGRYSPVKGLETIIRGAELAGVHLEVHGSDAGIRAVQAQPREDRGYGRARGTGIASRRACALRAKPCSHQQHGRRLG